MSDPMDVSVSSCLARVVEVIISQYQWFFQNDAQPSWDHQLPAQLCPATDNHLATPLSPPASFSHHSPVPNTRERKSKVKKAPLPPDTGSPSSSPSHTRYSGDSFSQSSSEASISNHRKTNSVDTIEVYIPSSPQHQLYPSLPPKDSPNTKDLPYSVSPFPVPAPRNIKPAIPNKPEGISR